MAIIFYRKFIRILNGNNIELEGVSLNIVEILNYSEFIPGSESNPTFSAVYVEY